LRFAESRRALWLLKCRYGVAEEKQRKNRGSREVIKEVGRDDEVAAGAASAGQI